MNLVSVQKKLIILAFIIVPFLSVVEVFSLFTGNLNSQTQNLTGIFKSAKDFFIVLIIMIGFILSFKKKTFNKGLAVFLAIFIVVATPSIFNSSLNSFNLFAFFSGVRWLLPVLFICFIYNCVDSDLINRLNKVLLFLFSFHLCLQILQAFFAGGWYGVNSLGLNARNPGMFLIPNTAAFFSIGVLFFTLFINPENKKYSIFVVTSVFLSILLTLSGTGFLIYFFIVTVFIFKRTLILYFPLILSIILAVSVASLSFFEARGDNYVSESGGERVNVFIDVVESADFFSSNFGVGTNTYLLINGSGKVMDSLYASVILNLGYSGFFLTLAIILFSFIILAYSFNKGFFVFVTVFSVYSATNILFEVYPLNILFGISTVYYVRFFSGVFK